MGRKRNYLGERISKLDADALAFLKGKFFELFEHVLTNFVGLRKFCNYLSVLYERF